MNGTIQVHHRRLIFTVRAATTKSWAVSQTTSSGAITAMIRSTALRAMIPYTAVTESTP